MIRAALIISLALLAAVCLWLVATASGGIELALSLAVLSGFGIAAGWAAARRAT